MYSAIRSHVLERIRSELPRKDYKRLLQQYLRIPVEDEKQLSLWFDLAVFALEENVKDADK